jgi:signal transduction histidine kinase
MYQDQQIIIILVVVFTICLFTMGVFFFVVINKYHKNLNYKQKEALSNLILGQDNEQQRIARDLHDEMGPAISNVLFNVDKISANDPITVKLTTDIKNDLNQVIRRLRQISHNLMPQSLKKYGLVDALKDMVHINQYLNFTFEFSSNTDFVDLEDQAKMNIYNIVQELLYNSSKHSNASKVKLDLQYDEISRDLLMHYSDNGVGFENGILIKHGIGIKNIFTRVKLMNGEIEISGTHGFEVMIKLNF